MGDTEWLNTDETADRRTRIFNAAVSVFSQKGYSAATTKEIAEMAGVAEGTIFRYYRTKKSILDAIAYYFIDVMGDMAIEPVEKIFNNAKNRDLKELLGELIRDRIELVDKIYPVMSVVLTEILFHEDLRNLIFDKMFARGAKAFGGFYESMVSKGLIRADIPANAAFRSILANIMVFIAQYKLFPQSASGDMQGEINTLLDVILHGIA